MGHYAKGNTLRVNRGADEEQFAPAAGRGAGAGTRLERQFAGLACVGKRRKAAWILQRFFPQIPDPAKPS
jgi:hypothetical protein